MIPVFSMEISGWFQVIMGWSTDSQCHRELKLDDELNTKTRGLQLQMLRELEIKTALGSARGLW